MNVEAYMKDVINIANKGYMSSQLSRILSDPIGNQINKSSINKVANLTSGILANVLKEGTVLKNEARLKSRATSKDMKSRGKQDSFSDEKNFSNFSRFSIVPSRMSSIAKDQKENSTSKGKIKIKLNKNDESPERVNFNKHEISIGELASEVSNDNRSQLKIPKRMTETTSNINLDVKNPKSKFARLTSFEVAMNKIKVNQEKIEKNTFNSISQISKHRLSNQESIISNLIPNKIINLRRNTNAVISPKNI